jgi:tRNA threonylcarbamoyladenosine biosynthesis protein TsaB
MSFILSIETSTKICSVALHEEGNLVVFQKLMMEKSHSGLLALLIQDTLKYAGINFNQLDAVAVAKGPGSYTGLRIGTSTAKGICFAYDLPLISVSSLLAMARYCSGFNLGNFNLCPMIDARRMESYCMILDYQLNVLRQTNSVVFDSQVFDDISQGQHLLIFGDGASKYESMLIGIDQVHLLKGLEPLAEYLGPLAYDKFKNNDFEDLAYFEPFYLKDFRISKPKES